MRFLLFLIFIGLVACKPQVQRAETKPIPIPSPTPEIIYEAKMQTISGEVFVVTQGGMNMPLGRVSVYALPLQEVKPQLKVLKEGSESILQSVEPLLREAEKMMDSVDVRNPSWSKGQDTLSTMRDIKSYLTSSLFYFSQMRVKGQSIKTDSAGRYKMELLPGDYAILARASRSVGDQTEYYYWLLASEVEVDQDLELTLSNDNMTSSGSRNSLITTDAYEPAAFAGKKKLEEWKRNPPQVSTPPPTPLPNATPDDRPSTQKSYRSLTRLTANTPDGIYAIPEGSILKFIRQQDSYWRMTDGEVEFLALPKDFAETK